MNADEEIAPEVRSILDAAASRSGDDEPLAIAARSLPNALNAAAAAGRAPVIGEIKPTSPTTDGTQEAAPLALARAMVQGGAAALSVLTEPEHFGGSPETLATIRSAVDVPVLRKDFILNEAQLDIVPADIVLLIARFVDDLERLLGAARERGFQVLVEVHTADELARALEAGATLIGVNNRDLARLEVDLATFERLAPEVPDDVVLIAESGITSPADVERMLEAGADGLLIGTAIMQGPRSIEANTERLTHL